MLCTVYRTSSHGSIVVLARLLRNKTSDWKHCKTDIKINSKTDTDKEPLQTVNETNSKVKWLKSIKCNAVCFHSCLAFLLVLKFKAFQHQYVVKSFHRHVSLLLLATRAAMYLHLAYLYYKYECETSCVQTSCFEVVPLHIQKEPKWNPCSLTAG